MRRSVFAFSMACAAILAAPAMADPAYTSKDILNHFAPNGDLGGTRGICIGTEAECGTAQADSAATAAQSYDLLITFDLDSDVLTAEARENLSEFAKALQEPVLAQAKFEVDGHTDARGGDSYNLTLSERRARAVIAYLGELGVDTNRLVAKGFGKSKPRTDDPFDAVNRRVETRLVLQ